MKNSSKTDITDRESRYEYFNKNCRILDHFCDKVKLMPIGEVDKCLKSMDAGDDEAFKTLQDTLVDFKNRMKQDKLMDDTHIYQSCVSTIMLWLDQYHNVLRDYDIVVERTIAICENNKEILLEIFTMNKKGDDQNQLFLMDESLTPIFEKVSNGEIESKEYVDIYQQAFNLFLKRIKK